MILVAGATGHLGAELVPLLLRRGGRIRALARDPERARHLLGPDIDSAKGDVRDAGSLRSALAGAQNVVSAITGFGPGGSGVRAIDQQGNMNLIRAAESAGVKHFVLISMRGAAPDAPMELLRAKHAAEESLRASTLAWTVIRPTVFMELWTGIVGGPLATKGRTTVFGRGDNPVNLVSARDVARFVDLALRDPELRMRTLEVGGPEDVTLDQLAAAVAAVAGKGLAIRHVPLPVMRLAATLLRPLRPDIAGMIGAGVQMDTTDMTFDATELQRRYPTITLTRLAEVIAREYGASAMPSGAVTR